MGTKKQRNINAAINSEVADLFYEQIDERGHKVYRAVEGSLRLWISLPSEIQALLIHCPNVDTTGIAELLGQRLREALSNTSTPPEQSEQTPERQF